MATAPTPIPAGPPVPNSALPEPTFDAQYEAFNKWERDELAPKANALAQNVYENTSEVVSKAASAADSASVATTQADAAMGYRNAAQASANTATTKAGEANASAIAASKLNLGDKAAPPTTDNQGDPLRAGATYFDTTLDKWRVWSGTAWGDGISAVAGVASLNGETGALVKTTLAGYGITDALPNTGAIAANGSVRGNKIAVPALDIDCSKSNYFTKAIAANSTFTFSNVPAAPARYAMIVEVALTGGAITWPAGVIWPNGSAPSLSTGKTHLFFFITADGGTTWRANALTNYAG